MTRFNTYSKIYRFSTENLHALDFLEIQNKKVLTVAGGGDQCIEFYARGASSVTMFDINQNSRHWVSHKLAALQVSRSLKLFLSCINAHMPVNFTEHSFADVQNLVPYLHNENSYARARDNIQDSLPTFICSGIDSLTQKLHSEKFDIIYLSNIADYSHMMFETDAHVAEFINICVAPLLDNLNPNGILVPAYIYDSDNKHHSDKRNILNNQGYRQNAYRSAFVSIRYEEHKIKSAIDGTTTDSILILKTC